MPADFGTGRIDTIMAYEIDLLSYLLLNFAGLVEKLEEHRVSPVTVTQQMDISTSIPGYRYIWL